MLSIRERNDWKRPDEKTLTLAKKVGKHETQETMIMRLISTMLSDGKEALEQERKSQMTSVEVGGRWDKRQKRGE